MGYGSKETETCMQWIMRADIVWCCACTCDREVHQLFPFWLLIPDLTLCTILYAMTVTCAAVALCVSAAANELNRRMQRELDSIREELRQAGEVQRPGKEEESNESSEEGSARNTQAEQA